MRVLPRPIAEPLIEPATLSQLRAQVSGDEGVDDALLRSLLITARAWVEQFIGRPVPPQTVRAVFEGWPAGCRGDETIILLMPVSSVDAINYTGPDQVVTSWTDFVARTSAGGVTAVRPKAGTSWPGLGDDPVITLNATAGFAEVPEPVLQAMMMMAAYLYANRDGIGDSRTPLGGLPADVRQLLRPWRWQWIG